MRYFLSTVANRPSIVGDRTFTFEPTTLRGGSWLGVLALDEPDASILFDANLVTVGEITEERYEDEKKKLWESQQTSPIRQSVPPLRIVEPVADPTRQESSEASPVLKSETLKTTTLEPPGDPLLEDRDGKKSRSK